MCLDRYGYPCYDAGRRRWRGSCCGPSRDQVHTGAAVFWAQTSRHRSHWLCDIRRSPASVRKEHVLRILPSRIWGCTYIMPVPGHGLDALAHSRLVNRTRWDVCVYSFAAWRRLDLRALWVRRVLWDRHSASTCAADNGSFALLRVRRTLCADASARVNSRATSDSGDFP